MRAARAKPFRGVKPWCQTLQGCQRGAGVQGCRGAKGVPNPAGAHGGLVVEWIEGYLRSYTTSR
jgi:hypothetical protein